MKRYTVYLLLMVIFLGASGFKKHDRKEPWSKQQLIQPADLASKLNDLQASNTIIFDIGPAGRIKNAIEIGPMQDANNLALFRKKLDSLSKTTEVVIYCGCCPFEHCPNIRPAFKLLNEMHFTNAKLLNLSNNLKADWIDEGYPMQN